MKVFAKSKHLLLLIRHTPCYLYIQSSPIKVFAVIEERQKCTKKLKNPLTFEIWIIRYGQPDRDDDRRISRAIDQ